MELTRLQEARTAGTVKPLCKMTAQELSDYMGGLDEEAHAARNTGDREGILALAEEALAEVNARRRRAA